MRSGSIGKWAGNWTGKWGSEVLMVFAMPPTLPPRLSSLAFFLLSQVVAAFTTAMAAVPAG
jgi:hypothetical protein